MSRLDPAVYRIVNKVTNHCYVGSSAYVMSRKSKHMQALRRNAHENLHLQRAWNKYGEGAFVFEVLERCERDVCFEREQYWINTLCPQYNIRKTADPKGPLSAETRQRIREARFAGDAAGKLHGGAKPNPSRPRSRHHIRTDEERQEMHNRRVQASAGRTMSSETREKIQQAHLGKKASSETREKLRISHLGQQQSPETLEKNRQAQLGRTLSPEAREKIRQSKLGKPRSLETREKLRQAHLGKKQSPELIRKRTQHPISEETRQKLSLARRAADVAGKPHGGPQKKIKHTLD